MPVPVRAAAVSSPAHTDDRQECLSSIAIELPKPQPRIAAVSLAPAPPLVEVARIHPFVLCADAARARVEARMALAELRGSRAAVDRVRHIVVVVPDVAPPEIPPEPATL